MKKVISVILSVILMCSCLSGLSFVNVNASTSNNWSWPTSINSLKSDWPTYSSGSYHGGTDFAVPLNSPVYSTCDGEVITVTSLTTSYGKHIKIRATVNGSTVYMRYCHLNSFAVSKGDKVKSGQLIGYSGSTGNSTGPHLHYEVRNANDYYGNASSPNLNPKYYLPGTNYTFESYDTNPPTNVTLSTSQNWYDLQDTITLYANADNATDYTVVIDNSKGTRLVYQKMNGNQFSISAKDLGGIDDYYACVIAGNSAGSVQSAEWIHIPVVGEPGYSSVSVSNWWYDLTDTVSINVTPICSKGQVIGIDKNGVERVITQDCDYTFTIPAAELGVGEYSAYFTVYNGSGKVDTERVTFGIVDKPKEGATASVSKCSYTLNDIVELSVLAYCTKGQVIGIDKNGVERVVTEDCGTTYTVPASQLGRGKYSAYFSVYNGSDGYDTERVEFAIDNPLSNPYISVNNSYFDIEDQINIQASAGGGVNEYTLVVYDNNGNEVKTERLTDGEFVLKPLDLGVGTYTATVTCSNYAFEVDTDTIKFEISADNLIADVNNDGYITINDVTEIQKYLAKYIDFEETQKLKADVSGDGKISIRDATMIQMYIAKMITL